MSFVEYQAVVPLNAEDESGFTIITGEIFDYAVDESRVAIGELTAFYLDVDWWLVCGLEAVNVRS